MNKKKVIIIILVLAVLYGIGSTRPLRGKVDESTVSQIENSFDSVVVTKTEGFENDVLEVEILKTEELKVEERKDELLEVEVLKVEEVKVEKSDSYRESPTVETKVQTVWLAASGEKYHRINDCGMMNPDKATQVTLEKVQSQGYESCDRCQP